MSSASNARKSPKTLLDLPSDIRLEIYDWVFFSTTLEAGNNRAPAHDGRHADTAGYGPAGPLFQPPIMPEQLNLVCRLLNSEIGRSWHSKVTYYFPSTVAFLDVLCQWSRQKLETVRHVHVCGYPLPLNSISEEHYGYCTHFINDALPILTGLRLDVLTVENVWLEPDGEEIEGWCLDATRDEVSNLLTSCGWKELRYLSGTLGLLVCQLHEIEEKVAKMKKERGDESFTYSIEPVRPRLSGLVSHKVGGEVVEHDSAEDKAEVAEWESRDSALSRPLEKRVQVRAWRGTERYAQTGEERTEWISNLLEQMSWVELRASGKYLVDDGTEDFCAHL